MTPPRILAIAALLGALAVILGAFAAHGLEHRLDADRLRIFETAVRYQMYHALGLGLCGLAGVGQRLRATAWCFLGGITLFSGSLYLLAVTDTKWLGAVAPIGGSAFIVGWLLLGWHAWRPNE